MDTLHEILRLSTHTERKILNIFQNKNILDRRCAEKLKMNFISNSVFHKLRFFFFFS